LIWPPLWQRQMMEAQTRQMAGWRVRAELTRQAGTLPVKRCWRLVLARRQSAVEKRQTIAGEGMQS